MLRRDTLVPYPASTRRRICDRDLRFINSYASLPAVNPLRHIKVPGLIAPEQRRAPYEYAYNPFQLGGSKFQELKPSINNWSPQADRQISEGGMGVQCATPKSLSQSLVA